MRTEDLIVSLAADAGPVRLLPSTPVRVVRWWLTVMVSALVAVWAIGMRADLASAFATATWVSEFVLVAALCVMAGIAAQMSGVPGAPGARAVRVGALVLLAAWGGLLMARLTGDGAPVTALLAEPSHAACVLRIVAIALVPGAMAWWQLRRAAALQPGWSAVLAAVGALGAGAAAAQVMCPIDRAAHVLTWHVLPVAALGAAAGIVAALRRRAWA